MLNLKFKKFTSSITCLAFVCSLFYPTIVQSDVFISAPVTQSICLLLPSISAPINYAFVANDLLNITKPSTAQFPAGVTKSFEYENHKVKRVKDAKNQYFVENFYDTFGRVQRQNLGGNSRQIRDKLGDKLGDVVRR